jgi:surface protein
MEKNPYGKNKYLEKHQYLNVSQAELERKWRLYEEEQMKLMMSASAPGNAYSVPFISTWKTDNLSTGSSNSNQVKLPLIPDGSYNFYVNWGDGTFSSISSWNQPEVTHTYPAIGTYTISITGAIRGWDWGTGTSSTTPTTGDRLKILTITQWGCLRFVDKGGVTLIWGAFYNCTNLTLLTVVDTPNFEGTTSTLGMFRGCSAITTINNINNWDVSGIKYFRSMLREMPLFNDNVGNWDTSSAIDFTALFSINAASATSSFNNGGSDSIRYWNTSNVTTMNGMFNGQSKFNQPIGDWDVSNVTDMGLMLQGPATAPHGVFNNGGSDSIKNWDTSKVTNMSVMLASQPNFNQPIGNWNTSNVTNMSFVFFSYTTGVTTFNQDLSNWNTSKATNMDQMFRRAKAFNQDIGDWDVSLVANFNNFMANRTFNDYSTANYDALLIGWASRPVKPNLSINFGTIKRTAASTSALAVLTSAPNNWTIVDGGL